MAHRFGNLELDLKRELERELDGTGTETGSGSGMGETGPGKLEWWRQSTANGSLTR